MTRDTALHMLDEYAAVIHESGHDDWVLTQMPERFPPSGDIEKAMRWLGFVQGAAYALGVFTLDEMIDHARRGYVGDPVRRVPRR